MAAQVGDRIKVDSEKAGVPAREGEILEIPAHERAGLEFVYVSEVGEALAAALEPRR